MRDVPGTAYGSASEALARVAPLLAGLLAGEVQRRLADGRYARVATADGEQVVLASQVGEVGDAVEMAGVGQTDTGIAGVAHRALAAVAVVADGGGECANE